MLHLENSLALGPANAPLKVNCAFPVLVMVNCCTLLLVPTRWLPKASAVVETEMPGASVDAATAKLLDVAVMLTLEFSARVAVSVSLASAAVKMRLPKLAWPLAIEVEAVAGLVVRSLAVSVMLTVAGAVVYGLPLSVTSTRAAGDRAAPALTPEGWPAASKARA